MTVLDACHGEELQLGRGGSSIATGLELTLYVVGMQFQEGSFGCITRTQTHERNQVMQC